MQLPTYPQDFNALLHEIRLAQMRQLDVSGDVMVSVGCNGRQYFEIIHETMGTPRRHVGLEYYLPEPADLPPNVEWVANTAADMERIESCSVDVVFAGQTVEHLWSHELLGFLAESWRVLRTGGRLVIDSPNEAVVHALHWNHPEHTIEFRPSDARELVEAAGFRVDKVVGHWLCRTPQGALLDLMPTQGDEQTWSTVERVEAAGERSEDSFSWWLEATKVGELDAARLSTVVRRLWSEYGETRIQRMMQSQSVHRTEREGRTWALASLGWLGALVFGPHMALPKGKHVVAFDLEPYSVDESPGWVEVFKNTPNDQRVLARAELPTRLEVGMPALVAIDLPDTTFGLEFRMWCNGTAELSARVGATVLKVGL